MSREPGTAERKLSLALAECGYVDPDPVDQYRLINAQPILAKLREMGFELVPARAAERTETAGLREALREIGENATELATEAEVDFMPLVPSVREHWETHIAAIRALAADPQESSDV